MELLSSIYIRYIFGEDIEWFLMFTLYKQNLIQPFLC